MTLSTLIARKEYSGNGTITAFAFPYYFLQDEDLIVYLQDASGTQSTKTLGSDYTVSGEGVATGGTITFAIAPEASSTVAIYRDVSFTQVLDLQYAGTFNAESIEQNFDRTVMQLQSIKDLLNRCAYIRETDTSLSMALPLADDRTSSYLGFDSSGRFVALSVPASTSAVTAFMATVLDDANATTALATLGFSGYVVQNLIDDTSASAVLTTLGFSAFGKTIIDDSNAATMRQTIGSDYVAYTNISSAATLTSADNFANINASASALTVTLPSAVSLTGKPFFIKKTDPTYNLVTVKTNPGETLDGVTATTLATQYEQLNFLSDGANWQVLNRRIDQTWKAFTPTGNFTGSTVYHGMERRVGDSLEIMFDLSFSGSPNSGNFSLRLPHSLAIDSSKLTRFGAGIDTYGVVNCAKSGVGTHVALITQGPDVSVVSAYGDDGVGQLTELLPFTYANGDAINGRFVVPITNWKG